MNAGPVRKGTTPRRLAVLALAILLATVLAGGFSEPQAHPVSGEAHASALTIDVGILANRTVAGRRDAVLFTAWAVLSGSGVAQQTWFNISLGGAFLPDPTNASAPAECAATALLRWECANLRAGNATWSIPAQVEDNATLGTTSAANVTGAAISGGTYTGEAWNEVRVDIVGVTFTIETLLDPGETVRRGDVLLVTILANNTAPGCDEPYANQTQCAARWVTLSVDIEPWLFVDPGASRNASSVNFTAGSLLTLEFRAIVPADSPLGTRLGLTVRLLYEDFDGRAVRPAPVTRLLTVQERPLLATGNAIVAAVIAVVAIAAVLGLLLILGQRNLRIEELFLMHRSGILLLHVSRSSALEKDDELVASMLVAVQDFVRDSFRTEGALDEFRFSGRRAALVRGRDIILAGIISRGDVSYVVPQLRAAIEDVEKAHGDVLANFDGRMARLDRLEPILRDLLDGEYRMSRAWKGLVKDAREGIRPSR